MDFFFFLECCNPWNRDLAVESPPVSTCGSDGNVSMLESELTGAATVFIFILHRKPAKCTSLTKQFNVTIKSYLILTQILMLVRSHVGGGARWEAAAQNDLFRLLCLGDWGDVAEGFHAWHRCLCLYKILEFWAYLTKNVESSAWFSMHHVPACRYFHYCNCWLVRSKGVASLIYFFFNVGNILAKIHLLRLCSFYDSPVRNNSGGLWSTGSSFNTKLWNFTPEKQHVSSLTPGQSLLVIPLCVLSNREAASRRSYWKLCPVPNPGVFLLQQNIFCCLLYFQMYCYSPSDYW